MTTSLNHIKGKTFFRLLFGKTAFTLLSILGIAILQDEGLCTETLLNSDILVRSIFDVFSFLKDSNRLIATLRN